MAVRIACPQCQAVLLAPAEPPVQTKLQCKQCGSKFRYQGGAAPAADHRTDSAPSPSASLPTRGTAIPPDPAAAASPAEGGKSGVLFVAIVAGILLLGGGGLAAVWMSQRGAPDGPSDGAVDPLAQQPADSGENDPTPAPGEYGKASDGARSEGDSPSVGPPGDSKVPENGAAPAPSNGSHPPSNGQPPVRRVDWQSGALVKLEPIGAPPANEAPDNSPAAVAQGRVLLGSSAAIQALKFSPDDRHLASSGGNVLLWNLASGQSTPIVGSDAAALAAFAGDGQVLVAGSKTQAGAWQAPQGQGITSFPGLLLAAGGSTVATYESGKLALWDIAARQVRFSLDVDRQPPVAVAADGHLAAIGVGSEIHLVDMPDGARRQPIGGIPGEAKSLHLSADGALLACGEGDSAGFSLWDVRNPAGRARLEHREQVRSLNPQLSPDGRTMSYGNFVDGQGTMVFLWDVASRSLRGSFAGYTPVAFSADSQSVVAMNRDQAVVADVQTAKVRTELDGQPKQFSGVAALSSDGRMAAIGGADGAVYLRSAAPPVVRGLRELATIELARKDGVKAIAFSGDGRYVAAADDDTEGALHVIEIASQKVSLEVPRTYAWTFQPDGKSMLAARYLYERGYEFKKPVHFDLEGGRQRTLPIDRRIYRELQPTPDGRTAAALMQVTRDETRSVQETKVVLLDLPTLQEGKEFLTTDRAIENGQLAFSPDGKLLALRSGGALKVWEVATGRERPTNATSKETAHGIAFVDDTTVAGWNRDDAKAYLYDTDSGQLLRTIDLKRGHTGSVSSVAFSGKSPHFVSVGRHGNALLRDLATGDVIARLPGHDGMVTGAGFSSDGRLLATADENQVLKVWELNEIAVEAEPAAEAPRADQGPGGLPFELREYAAFDYETRGDYDYLQFSQDGTILAAQGGQGVLAWDLAAKTLIYPTPNSGKHRGGGHYGRPTISPDGRLVVSWGSNESGTSAWLIAADLTTGKVVPEPLSLTYNGAVAFRPDGKQLAVGQATGSGAEGPILLLIDAATQQTVRSISGFDAQVDALSYTPDGAHLLAMVKDRQGARLVRLDPQTLEQRAVIAELSSYSKEIFVSPDGRTVGAVTAPAGSTSSAGLTFWDVASGNLRSQTSASSIRHFQFVGDMSQVLLGSGAYELSLYDVNTGQQRQTMPIYKTHQQHGSRSYTPWDVAFSADRRWLASGDAAGVVILWDAVQCRPVAKFQAHQGRVLTAEFSPDGRFLATAGEEKKLKLWTLDPPASPAR